MIHPAKICCCRFARSIRAWISHRRQYDRLAFASGHFRIVLYDIRPNSRTLNLLNVFILGVEQPGLLGIPPFVVHGVQNACSTTATFVNMPTQAYDPADPDKSRLAENDPRIPFSFDIREVS
jgi:dTDP-4-dehydrorhamnose 3,5-epimerase